jgi:lysyl-tRNA synthetase class 2
MADPNAEITGNPAGGDPTVDRRVKLNKLRDEIGVDPFGGRVDGLVSLEEARKKFDPQADADHKAKLEPDRRPVVKVAGRIVLHRDIGKLVFLTIRDSSGDMQVAVSKNSVDETSMKIAKLADLGDVIVAQGPLGTTKTGEVTVWAAGAEAFAMAVKSLAPPPEKWHGLTDPEQRYRKRYVDLYVNPGVMKTMQLRIRIVEEIRQYLRGRGFLEVETPMMQPLAGGAAARPFETHHNALDIPLFLRIAPELYLKRLLVGGFPKVFEVNRNFRNEGISPRHNPEFTMLEAYEAFGSWETMADLVEEMICTVAMNVFGTLKIEHKNAEGVVTKTINLEGDLSKPRGQRWRRVRMDALVEERTGWKFDKRQLQETEAAKPVMNKLLARRYQEMSETMAHFEKNIDSLSADDITFPEFETNANMKLIVQRMRNETESLSAAEQLVRVYEKLIESTLVDPTFVTHVPSVCIPLARECKDDPFFADVYELAINGQEISPGYSELNDPDVQERHFRHQVGDKAEQQKVDEDFLEALRVGMPPAGGMGLGIDRLVMMLTGAASIRDVILFPLMRPQGN